MATSDPVPTASEAGQFEYFMLRVHRAEERPDAIAGQVERLGTGEKRRFDTAGELLALVERWPVPLNGEER